MSEPFPAPDPGQIRIVLISSVRPEPTSAGEIILHRHLIERSDMECQIFGFEPDQLTMASLIRRMAGRLAKSPLHRLAHDFWVWENGRWLDGFLPKGVRPLQRTIVLTVAQGDACGAARRFAKKHRLPLVTFFHDWWPDMVSVHAPFRRLLEKQISELYQESDLAFCVCDEMREALGAHPNSRILYPIPSQSNSLMLKQRRAKPFRLLFFGNLGEYSHKLAEALDALKHHQAIRLEVRGRNPRWKTGFGEEMRRAGLWLDYVPRNQMNDWLNSADAFLVPMVFDPAMRKRMETSFPSKMVEMAQLHKPLIIWGPDYCSAVRWAKRGNRALCVADPSPIALRNAIERLANSHAEQQRLADSAIEAARTDFNPDRIHKQFLDALNQLTGAMKRSASNPAVTVNLARAT